jgi:ZIP family zinc transporter
VGVFIGYGLGVISSTLLPIMLGFAGGAMLYVTSDEMIPETHAHGYQKQATYALLLGFMSMLLLEEL